MHYKTTWTLVLTTILGLASTARSQTKTCEPGTRVEISCKTARGCEKAIGKAEAFDALKKRTDGLLRDAAARERVCLDDKEAFKVQMKREGDRADREALRVNREVVRADRADAQLEGASWRVPVGVTLVILGLAVGVSEVLVDETPSVPQMVGAGVVVLGGGALVVWEF